MRVVSVLQGKVFSRLYAKALNTQCNKYGYEFICLTDNEFNTIKSKKLKTSLYGWWSKLELFAPWNEHLRPFLFVDLDTYILNNIDGICESDKEKFWMLRDFKGDRLASGLMYVPENEDRVWKYVIDNNIINNNPWPDDGKLIANIHSDAICFQDRYSGIYSYKYHCKDSPKQDSKIICFHGRPKPPEAKGWAREYWEEVISG